MEKPNESPQAQNRQLTLREVNQINPKWETWLRIFLSFLLGGFSYAFFLGSKSRNIDELLTWKGEATSQFSAIVGRIDRMDTNGTARSHWVDEQQTAQITQNVHDINEIRAKREQTGETISVMQGKIERLDSEIKRLEDKGK